jgi:hypothetical protein
MELYFQMARKFEETSWDITQSLKDIAVRSPATMVRLDDTTASSKHEAYERLWAQATPI